MASESQKQADKRNASINEPVFNMADTTNDMPEWDNETQVLAFLAEYQIPLKPAEVYGGLIYTGTITFKYRTTQNKLRALYEAGYADRVQVDRKAGRVKPPPEDGEEPRPAHVIAAPGPEELEPRIGADRRSDLRR